MLKRIVMQVNGLLMVQFTRLWALLTERLWLNVKPLLVNTIQGFLNVVSQLFLRVQTVLNINRFRVSLTIVVVSIKAELINALVKVTLLGQQLLTTARQTLQRVLQVLQQTKDRLVVYIKSALSRFKGIGFVQTHTEVQSTQDGEKLKGLVQPLQQPVKQRKKRSK